MRYIVLDTETTGLDPDNGHKIIEIGCIEILNRNITNNTFHKYINPNREIDIEASKIHGLTNSVLKDKPLFEEIYLELREYISNSPIIIHNAPFDVGFLKKEHSTISMNDDFLDNEIIDSLKLCESYSVDNSDRTLHGALLDAKLLAFVYLKMTIGQNHFSDLTSEHHLNYSNKKVIDDDFKIIEPSDEDKELNLNYFNES